VPSSSPKAGLDDLDRQAVARRRRADRRGRVGRGLERDHAPAAAELAQPPRGRQRVDPDVRADVGDHVAGPQLGREQPQQAGLVAAGEEQRPLQVVAQVEVEAETEPAGVHARLREPPPLRDLPEIRHRHGPAARDAVDALGVAARRPRAGAHRGGRDRSGGARPDRGRQAFERAAEHPLQRAVAHGVSPPCARG
jgi:hypothetical protein